MPWRGREDSVSVLLEHIIELEECQQGQEREKTGSEGGTQVFQARQAQVELLAGVALLVNI